MVHKVKTMKRFLVRLEEASGMEINPRKYFVDAKNKNEAELKALMKDGYDEQEAKDLLKDRAKAGAGYSGDLLGGDVVYIEVDEIGS